jgi:hypothetical protein
MSSPIVDLAIEFLRADPTGGQRFEWAPQAEEALPKIVGALFDHPQETRSGIDDLLRLVCALELELRSPQTAARLRTILRLDPRVVALCDVDSRGDELRQAQSRWAGLDQMRQAPVYGRAAPAGTVRAASLLDPGLGAARGGPRRPRGAVSRGGRL